MAFQKSIVSGKEQRSAGNPFKDFAAKVKTHRFDTLVRYNRML